MLSQLAQFTLMGALDIDYAEAKVLFIGSDHLHQLFQLL